MMAVLKAFSVLSDSSGEGEIVFASSNVEARRYAADRYNGGEFGGLSVRRKRHLDQYRDSGVPARILVEEGWWFECSGCGSQIEETNQEERGLSIRDVVGTQHAAFCCHLCRTQYFTERAAKEAFGSAFKTMLADMVLDCFPGATIEQDRLPWNASVCGDLRALVVRHAEVCFSFPGMKIGPAVLEYRHEGPHGRDLIGPVKPEFRCCLGDKEAFERYALLSAGVGRILQNAGGC